MRPGRLVLVLAAALALAVPAAGASASPAPRPAVLGGTVAAPGAWPSVARIDIVTPDGLLFPPDGQPDVDFQCMGSLVGARWVLTAGHCMLLFGQVIGTPGFVPGIRFRVVIGGTAAHGITSPADVYDVEPGDVVALEPSAGSISGDLALLRLDRPAPQQALRIVGTGQDARPFEAPGLTATAIGWGSTAEDDPNLSENLRQVEVPLVADAECAREHPAVLQEGFVFGFEPHTMICAGEEGRDTCFGDSGGPLMVPDGAGGWVQIGITSWGEGCGEKDLPGVYGRLSGLFGFVLTALAADLEAPAGPPAAATDRAGSVTRRSARLIGTVTPNGLATVYVVEVGINRRYTAGRFQAYAGAGADPVAVSHVFTGLKAGTTYHYRVTAISLAGVIQGADRTFTTKPPRR